jgi:hypothetical protein
MRVLIYVGNKADKNALALGVKEIKDFSDAYKGIDVPNALGDLSKRSRNLNLADKQAAVLWVRNELSLLRSRAAAKASARMAAAAASKLSKLVQPDSEPPMEAKLQEPEPRKPAEKPSTTKEGRHMSVEIFRSTRSGSLQVMIQTTTSALPTFINSLAKATSDAIHNEPEKVDELLHGIFAQAIPLAIKIAGYKVESVKEERILTSGFLTPNEGEIVGQADE